MTAYDGDQLDVFDQLQIDIPPETLSPIECSNRPGSKAFLQVQQTFCDYVRTIQQQHACSWLEARNKFFAIRGSAEGEPTS